MKKYKIFIRFQSKIKLNMSSEDRDFMSPDVNDGPLLASTSTSGAITSGNGRQTNPNSGRNEEQVLQQNRTTDANNSQTIGSQASVVSTQVSEVVFDFIGEELEKGLVSLGAGIREGLKMRRLEVSPKPFYIYLDFRFNSFFLFLNDF